FLQDQTYLPLGGRVVAKADVRVLAASNVELGIEVDRGRFRRDLWFRLNVLRIRLPALRERSGDVRILAETFLERFCRAARRGPTRIEPASLRALDAYHWPGNVRELESLILREFLLHESTSDELTIALAPAPSDETAPLDFKTAKAHAVAEFERR